MPDKMDNAAIHAFQRDFAALRERMATVIVVVGAAGSFLGARLTSRFVSGPVLKQVFGVLIVVMTAVKVVAIVTS